MRGLWSHGCIFSNEVANSDVAEQRSLLNKQVSIKAVKSGVPSRGGNEHRSMTSHMQFAEVRRFVTLQTCCSLINNKNNTRSAETWAHVHFIILQYRGHVKHCE